LEITKEGNPAGGGRVSLDQSSAATVTGTARNGHRIRVGAVHVCSGGDSSAASSVTGVTNVGPKTPFLWAQR